MIPFTQMQPRHQEAYNAILHGCPERGCEYSFLNQYLWGRQEIAFLHGCVLFFAHFYGRSLYPYPIGPGDRRAALEAIFADADARGIPCRITGITEADLQELQEWFPDRMHIRPARDYANYVYAIDDLADLRGRKFQPKRNHVNRFFLEHPQCRVEPLTPENLEKAKMLTAQWFSDRLAVDPHGDYLLENVALSRFFNHFSELSAECILLMDGDTPLALTIGSRLSPDTFDVHFEKALENVSGAYAAINREFARYLRLKYPEIRYLNREEDMGLPGLRAAKESYRPHHMVEVYQAVRREDLNAD